MATRRGDPGISFDHGAQYFTARDPHFQRCVQSWIEQGIVAVWTGAIAEIDASEPTPPQARAKLASTSDSARLFERRVAKRVACGPGV